MGLAGLPDSWSVEDAQIGLGLRLPHGLTDQGDIELGALFENLYSDFSQLIWPRP